MEKSLVNPVLPRTPRNRGSKRRVVQANDVITMTEFPDKPLSDRAISDLLDIANPIAHRDVFIAGLWDIAGEYLRACDQPQTSRKAVRHSLKMLAYEIGAAKQSLDIDEQHLILRLDQIGPDVRDHLSSQLGISPNAISHAIASREINWAHVADAASKATAGKWSGDYADATIVLAVQNLIELYEHVTGKRATWSRKLTGPVSKTGTRRQSGGSLCAQFVHRFFTHIAPEVPFTLLDNYMRKILTRRGAGR